MTGRAHASRRVLGTLSSANGAGIVRIEDRYDTDVEDLWSALTEPERLARWYGEVEGDLHEGGQFRVYLQGPDINSVGRIELCDPPHRLLVKTRETDESARRGNGRSFEATTEATLTPNDSQTILVLDVSGLPLDKIASYGVGWQLHAESLANYLAGCNGLNVGARWEELASLYEDMAAQLN